MTAGKQSNAQGEGSTMQTVEECARQTVQQVLKWCGENRAFVIDVQGTGEANVQRGGGSRLQGMTKKSGFHSEYAGKLRMVDTEMT